MRSRQVPQAAPVNNNKKHSKLIHTAGTYHCYTASGLACHVRIFTMDSISANQWIQLGSDLNGIAGGDWFGHSVMLNTDGDSLVASAIGRDGQDGVDVG